MNNSQNSRLEYLDVVRALALILGVVFHASLSFMPIFIGWAVMDVSTSSAVTIFMLISHSFRMPLFFLLAGFFSHLAYYRYGRTAFFQSRLIRIGIPFLLGWIILRPLLVSSWVMGMESMQGDVHIWPALVQGVRSLLELPSSLLVGTHLWFLYYLLVITAVVVSLRIMLSLNSKVESKIKYYIAGASRWLSRSPLAVVLLAVPCTAILWHMDTWGLDTPDKSLMPLVPVVALYGFCFIVGWVLHSRIDMLKDLTKLRISTFVCSCIAVVSCIHLSGYEWQPAHEQYTMLKALFLFSYAVMMWSLIVLSIGLCRRFVNKPNAWVRYLSDASYWIYLIHLPIVIWLQIAVAETSLHWLLKWLLVSGVTVAVSLVLYDLLVRPTLIGRVLNGKRKASVIGHGIRQAKH